MTPDNQEAAACRASALARLATMGLLLALDPACSLATSGPLGEIGEGLPDIDGGAGETQPLEVADPADVGADEVLPLEVAAAPDTADSGSQRNPACKAAPSPGPGARHPWQGFAVAGQGYTCNNCPNGLDFFAGSWRFVDFATEDPATPLKNGYKERLTVVGNTWRLDMAGLDLGKPVQATVQGWYWCADPVELKSANQVFVAETVSPEGAFGWASGLVFSGAVLVATDSPDPDHPDAIAWGFYLGFESGSHYDAIYCRVGSTMAGHACSDPMAQ
jgi:hypothetical protein